MSDIEYLSIKEFDGKLKSNEGFLSAAGDLATLTASSGKDMYLASAKITWFVNSNTTVDLASEVVLKINGTIIETTKCTIMSNSINVGGVLFQAYEFKNIGKKVAATEIIKLEVITVGTEVDVEGFIECFEETTGESPAIT